MIPDDKDDRFSGAKSESYFSSRRELKKHEVTGEAVEMIREFIFKNLTAPTYSGMRKIKELGRSQINSSPVLQGELERYSLQPKHKGVYEKLYQTQYQGLDT